MNKSLANSVQRFPLLRGLRRWLVGMRWQSSCHRWAAWARALRDRHACVTERRDDLDLVLVRRLPLLEVLYQRWLVSSRRLFPQIQLSIQPFLRERAWHERAPLVGPSSEVSPNVIFETRAVQTPAPLRLVFQRLYQTDESIERLQSTAETKARILVERIARRSERKEERAREAVAAIIPRPGIVKQPQATTITKQQTFVTNAEGKSRQENTAPLPSIPIEQITDQVVRQLDRRVIAARERLGRR